MTAQFDTEDRFQGHEPRDCGEHRTVGSHRAWCYDCTEWYYPSKDMGCMGCELPKQRAFNKEVVDVLEELVSYCEFKFSHADSSAPWPTIAKAREILERGRNV